MYWVPIEEILSYEISQFSTSSVLIEHYDKV